MKTNLFSLLLCLAALTATQPVFATKKTVNNTGFGPKDYTDLPAAITALDTDPNTRDTLYMVGSTVMYNTTTIDKPVTIIGCGDLWGPLQAQGWGAPASIVGELKITTSQVTVVSVRLNNGLYLASGNSGINSIIIQRCYITGSPAIRNLDDVTNLDLSQCYIEGNITTYGYNANYVISNSRISNCYIYGHIYPTSTVALNLTIENNIIRDDLFLQATTSSHSLPVGSTVKNNIVIDDVGDKLYCLSCNMIGNVFTGTVDTVSAKLQSGTNAGYLNLTSNKFTTVAIANLFDPAYNTIPDKKYTLLPNSPAKTASYNNIECGIFGGNTPFILNGYPPLPRIKSIMLTQNPNNPGVMYLNTQVISQP